MVGSWDLMPERLPGDFITKVKQIDSQSDLTSMSSFAVPSYLESHPLSSTFPFEVLVFAIFTISAKLDPVTYVGHLTNVHSSFNEQITRAHFVLLQSSIRSSYFTVERATETLHRMSPCTPVSIPAQITW